MAEAIGLGASILGIAAFGATVVTTLRKFGGSYTRADEKLTILSADVALTASILTELGNTIKEYEKDLHLTAHNFVRVKAACERDFERLHKALRQAKKEEDGIQATNLAKVIGKRRVIEALSPWEKLKFALGGEAELEELVRSLETSKSNLQLLLDSVNLVILKKLNQKNLLNDDQSADLRDLVRHIPILVKVLQGAEFIPWSSKPITTVDILTSPEGFQSSATVGVSWVGSKDPKLGSNVLPAVSTPDCATNPPIAAPDQAMDNEKRLEESVVQDVDAEGKRDLMGDWPADRIQTVAYVSDGMKLPFPPPPPTMTASSTSGNIIPEPCGPRGEGKTQTLEHVRLSTVPKEKETEKAKAPSTRSSIDLETTYEGWLLEKNNDASIQPEFALSIMGFKMLKLYNTRDNVRRYSSDENDDEQDRLYTIKPYSTDQTALKEHIQSFQRKTAKADRQARMSLIVKSFEKYAQYEIKRLIRSRNKSSPKGYEWLVVAVIPLDKLRTRWLLSSIRSDRGLKQQSRLLLVLKGGSVAKGKSTQLNFESSSLPARYGNAWPQISTSGATFSPGMGHRSVSLKHFRETVRGKSSIKIGSEDSESFPASPLAESFSSGAVSNFLQYVVVEESTSKLAHGEHRSSEIDRAGIGISRGAESQFSSISRGSSYGRSDPPIRGERRRGVSYGLRTDRSDDRLDLQASRDEPGWLIGPRGIMRDRASREADVEIGSTKVSAETPIDKKKIEEREKEYKLRLEDDLRKSGMNAEEIALVLKNDKLSGTENRPTYTRMSRKHLSLETLNDFRIDYQLESDPDYVLIKRWVPEFEQNLLWAHTRRIRERRHPIDLSIEGEKYKHHDYHDDKYKSFEIRAAENKDKELERVYAALRKEAEDRAAKALEESKFALEKAKKESERAMLRDIESQMLLSKGHLKDEASRKTAEERAAKEREERMHGLEKVEREWELAIKEGNEEAIRKAKELVEEECQRFSEWDKRKVEVRKAVSDDSEREAKERAEQAREQEIKDAIDAKRMGLDVKYFQLERVGKTQCKMENPAREAALRELFREKWHSGGERASRVDEELESERDRRQRLERFALQNEPILARPAIPPLNRPGSYSAAGGETRSYDRDMPFMDEDDDLLPQADAERLMDEFLATFTDGGGDGKAAVGDAGQFTLADHRRTEMHN